MTKLLVLNKTTAIKLVNVKSENVINEPKKRYAICVLIKPRDFRYLRIIEMKPAMVVGKKMIGNKKKSGPGWGVMFSPLISTEVNTAELKLSTEMTPVAR